MNKKMKTYSKDDKDSVMPELSLNNEPKVDVSSVSHHSIKPDVVCSPKVRQSLDRMEKNFLETGLYNDPIDLSE